MSPYVLLPIALSDSDEVARNNMSAFWEDPNWMPHWQGKTLDFVIGEMKKRMPQSLLRDRDTYRQQKAVDIETGELVGFARWVLPVERTVTATGEPEWAELQLADVNAFERLAISMRFHSSQWDRGTGPHILNVPLERKSDEILKGGTYMSLDLLAVDPRHKGRGIATQLVESGIRQAESMGVDIFIMAFKAGLGMYRRLGFEMLDSIVQDDSSYGGDGEFWAYFLVMETSKSGRGNAAGSVSRESEATLS